MNSNIVKEAMGSSREHWSNLTLDEVDEIDEKKDSCRASFNSSTD